MTRLRATTHLGDGANQMFDEWIVALNGIGIEIDGAIGDDTALDADVVFACGLLTSVRQKQGEPLRVVGAPVFAGETQPVYRSVIIANPDVSVDRLSDASGLRLAVNEYGSWSGWHGVKEHLRNTGVPERAVGEHVLTGGHVHSIAAVLDGRADVASIDHSVWNARRSHDSDTDLLRVLESTRDWPSPPVSIRATLPDATQQQLTDAIVALENVQPAQLLDYAFMLSEAERR